MAIENLLPLIGTLGFGPAGGAVGTGIAGAIGQGKAKSFEDQYNLADKNVNPIDPGQVAMMAALKRQEGAYRAGTDAAAGFGMSGVRDMGVQAMSNIRRAGGGVGDLLRSQRVSDRGYADIAARSSGIANQLLGMRGGIVNDIANKVFGEQKYHRGMKYSQWQNAQQDANNNLQAATGMLAQGVPDSGFIGNLPGRGNPSEMQSEAAAQPTTMPVNPAVMNRSVPSVIRRPLAGAPGAPAYTQPNQSPQLPYNQPAMGAPNYAPWGPPVADPRSQYAPWTNY